MSAEFVDTNVIVYAYDPSNASKHEKARFLMERLWDSGSGVLSVQVLEELYVVITRKVPEPLSPQKALALVEDLSAWPIHAPQAADVIEAIRLSTRHRVSFWDAMIIHSATSSGATVLWSDDLAERSRFGSVEIRNPFS